MNKKLDIYLNFWQELSASSTAFQEFAGMAILEQEEQRLLTSLFENKEQRSFKYINDRQALVDFIQALDGKTKETASYLQHLAVELLPGITNKALSATYMAWLAQSKEETEQTSESATNNNTPKTLPEKIYQAVLDGNKSQLPGLLEEALKSLPAQEILNQHMIPAIMAVGDLYDQKVYYLPQLMQSAEAMKAGTGYLEPALKKAKAKSRGTIVIATVKGDIHDIGKNIVAIILENYGFKVVDLGKDIPKETILAKALEHNADIVALSALMTTTMVEMEHFTTYMREQGQNIPVMIGGAVVNTEYADKIGAHYSKDAIGATEMAGKILALKNS